MQNTNDDELTATIAAEVTSQLLPRLIAFLSPDHAGPWITNYVAGRVKVTYPASHPTPPTPTILGMMPHIQAALQLEVARAVESVVSDFITPFLPEYDPASTLEQASLPPLLPPPLPEATTLGPATPNTDPTAPYATDEAFWPTPRERESSR